MTKEIKCLDCPVRYKDFPLDVVLSRAQWLLINQKDKVVLCANCIVRRAVKIKKATVVHLFIEIAPNN